MPKHLLTLVLTFSLAAALWSPEGADAASSIERIARGTGEGFSLVDLSWSEAGRVTIKTKSAGFCTVTASFTGDLGNPFEVTLSETRNAAGPAIHSYDNNPDYTSSGVVQTFSVPAATTKKFFLNARMLSGAGSLLEVTRVWAWCAAESN